MTNSDEKSNPSELPEGASPSAETKSYRTEPVDSPNMPGGIPFIIGNEVAERFSFYGMKAILVIYMTKYLVDSNGTLDLMTHSEAISAQSTFVAAAYAFPILGAFVSDFVLGKYKTILLLSIVYCLGHLALALDDTKIGLITGLTLIAIGAGGIKPCVSAHVGDQFGPANKHLLSKVFSWFYFSINVGAFVAGLLIPEILEYFGQPYGPHIAFGLPGLLMLIATWVFWLGRRRFIHVPAGGRKSIEEAFTRNGATALLRVSIIFLCIVPFWSLFDQSSSAWVLQALSMDRNWLGIDWLPSQINAFNPIMILVLIPVFTYFVYPLMGRFFEPTPLRKMGIGLFITISSFAIIGWVETQITGGRIIAKSSEAKDWDVERLIDGESNGAGWASSDIPKSADFTKIETNRADKDRQQIVFQLRELKQWDIGSIRINPYTDKKGDDSIDHPSCWPKDILIEVADAPKGGNGHWKKVGRFQLKKRGEYQTIDFDSTQARYVRLEILTNWGGPRSEIGEIEIIADGSLPADAANEASDVWPNVAATGFKPSIQWQLLAYVLLTTAEILISITALEFAYTRAPKTLKSLVLSLFLLSVSLGNVITVLVNETIQIEDGTSRLPGASYYWFFTALMAITAVVFVVVSVALGRFFGKPESETS